MKHTFSESVIYELPVGREAWWGGWQTNGIVYYRTGLPLTITQTQGVQSTGTATGRTASATAWRPTRRSLSGSTRRVRVADRHSPAPTVTRAAASCADRSSSTSTSRSSRARRSASCDTEFRVEAFNVLNHAQFGNPNTTFGNAAFGQITAMLANPSCALCGTTERNIQVAFKIKF